VKLTRVHRVLEFTQKAWMEPYIAANTKRRALATSTFEKDFWKLASNSVFGESMEDVRGYRDITPMHATDKRLNKWKASPRWRGRIIVNENLVVAERYQKTTRRSSASQSIYWRCSARALEADDAQALV
jgi:hypothetical protein